MKKSTKLFALVLTLALVLGVFTVGALAATEDDNASDVTAPVTGEKFLIYSDFNDVEAKEYAGTERIPTNNGSAMKGMELTTDSDANKVLVVETNQGGIANKYLQITNDTDVKGTTAFYLNMDKVDADEGLLKEKLEDEAAQREFLENGDTLANIQYHVLDFDVFFPTGELTIVPSISLYLRAYLANGSIADLRTSAGGKLGYGATEYGVKFASYDADNNAETDNSQIVLETVRLMSGNSTKYPTLSYIGTSSDSDGSDAACVTAIEQDQWSHITMIIRSEHNSKGSLDLYFYTALNGVIINAHKMNGPASTYASKWMQGDMTGSFLRHVRINMANIGVGDTMNIDNFALRTYARSEDNSELSACLDNVVPDDNATTTRGKWEMNCNGADMFGWDKNAYDPATMPFGTAVAKIGDAEYTNIAAALKAAQDGDTIMMIADSAMNVTVNKPITINFNGKTVTGIEFEEGYLPKWTDTGVEVSKDINPVTVTWYECDCGEGCIEEIKTTVYFGSNIYDSYKKATGKDPICMGYIEDEIYYKHTGFEEISGVFEELGITFSNDMVVTEAIRGKSIELAPTYDEIEVLFTVDDTNVYEGFNNKTLAAIKDGSTVTLYGDVKTTETIIIDKANVTIDLNGYTISNDAAAAKHGTFNVTGDNFTITSSEAGATVNNANGAPVITAGADVAINVNGNIGFYCATVFESNFAAELKIDGANIYGNVNDGTALFNFAKMGATTEIKNAYIESLTKTVFVFGNATEAANVLVKDTVMITSKTNYVIANTTFAGLTATFENCYIDGTLNPTVVAEGATAPENMGATYVIKNSYATKDSYIPEASYAAGQAAKSVEVIKAYTSINSTITVKYTKLIADAAVQPVEVIWYAADGTTVIGTTTAIPGTYAVAPKTAVEGTNGMVVKGYNDWVGGTFVAFDATGTVSFTLAENAEPVYSAGKVNVMFNFTLRGTPEYNFYIPAAPEGITYKNILLAGKTNAINETRVATDSNGNKYFVVTVYPGLYNVDANYGCEVVFEYDGQQFTYSSAFVSVPKYVMYVLQAEEYANMPKLHTALADFVRAIEAAKINGSKATSEDLTKACAMAAPYMSDMEAIETTGTYDFGDAEKETDVAYYIKTLDFLYDGAIGGGGIAIKVVLKPEFAGSALGKETHVAIVTASNDGKYGQSLVGRNVYRSSRFTQAYNLRTYALAETFTISIYAKGDGNFTAPSNGDIVIKEGVEPVATATFTLEQFINSKTGATDNAMNFYKAFNALAKSSKAYMEWSYKAEA